MIPVSATTAILSLSSAQTSPTPVSSASPVQTLQVDPSKVGPGGWGFFFFVALFVAAGFLYFSMRKQLRRVDFDEEATEYEFSKSKATPEQVDLRSDQPPGRDDQSRSTGSDDPNGG